MFLILSIFMYAVTVAIRDEMSRDEMSKCLNVA